MTLGALDMVLYGVTGALTGMLGALLGLGGGVFLVPLLALGFHLEPRTAVAASLVAVIASSTASTILNMKRGLVNIPLAFTLLLATSAGAKWSATIAEHVSTRALYAIFAGTLFAIAAIVTSRSRTRNVLEDATMNVGRLGGRVVEGGRTLSYVMKRLPFALIVSLVAGAISGLLGVGGGVIQVPILNSFCGIPIRVAAATSAFMIGPTAAISAIHYLHRGDMNPQITAAIALGVDSGRFEVIDCCFLDVTALTSRVDGGQSGLPGLLMSIRTPVR
ncbi:MAG: sulfite exporter TauE/SafE family protein [Vicinamibacteria bacterium]